MELSQQDFQLIAELTRELRRQNDEILVSNNEAARLLNLTPQTISVYLKQGRLHRVQIRQSSGIRLSEVYQTRRDAVEPQA